MTTTTTPSTPTVRRNVAMVAARAFAGVLGAMQLAGMIFFLFLAPEEAVWRGPWIDVPIVALLLGSVLLKLTVSVTPGLEPDRRIGLGLVAVAVGVAVTLIKIPVYDEPEGVAILAFDAILVALLLLARRGERSH